MGAIFKQSLVAETQLIQICYKTVIKEDVVRYTDHSLLPRLPLNFKVGVNLEIEIEILAKKSAQKVIFWQNLTVLALFGQNFQNLKRP